MNSEAEKDFEFSIDLPERQSNEKLVKNPKNFSLSEKKK